jgi:hypothetical protein
VFLAKGAKVLMTSNLWVSDGLVNGATGTVIDFIFDASGHGAPGLLQAVIVNSPSTKVLDFLKVKAVKNGFLCHQTRLNGLSVKMVPNLLHRHERRYRCV